jgi:hypothetical protein
VGEEVSYIERFIRDSIFGKGHEEDENRMSNLLPTNRPCVIVIMLAGASKLDNTPLTTLFQRGRKKIGMPIGDLALVHSCRFQFVNVSLARLVIHRENPTRSEGIEKYSKLPVHISLGKSMYFDRQVLKPRENGESVSTSTHESVAVYPTCLTGRKATCLTLPSHRRCESGV